MVFAAAIALASQQVAPSRFQSVWPFAGLPGVRVDALQAKEGVAQEFANRLRLQGRVLWIDGTANLDRCNSDEKVADLMKKVANVGFNTVVYDVKPIVGRTLYPSKLADKLTEWKGQTMPLEFDPLAAMVREAHANGLSLLVSMNAFSEGHSYAKRYENDPDTKFGQAGWGYQHPLLQTWVLRTSPVVAPAGGGEGVTLPSKPNTMEEGVGLYTSKSSLPKVSWYVALDPDGAVLASSKDRPADGESFIAVADTGPVDKVKNDFPVGALAVFSAATRFVPLAEDQDQIPLMMNPLHPEVQERTYAFVDEVFANYDVDGLLFDDRLRFAGLDADFSEYSRSAFEQVVGHPIKWPDDVYRVTYDEHLRTGIDPGPYFDAWLIFRAQNLTDWVKGVRAHIPKGKTFGIYAGSWYGAYAQYGSNYGSDELQAGFPFLTRHYRETGFAKYLDVLITGCYYNLATIIDAMKVSAPIGRTVEAAGVITNRVAEDQCWTYAGLMLDDYKGDTRQLGRALQAAAATTQGVMVFDLSHNIDQYWDVFEKAFLSEPKKAPHQVPGLIEKVRQTRLVWEQNGWKEPPFPFFPGAPGAGF
ncbi:MAG TPA: alpha amylase family protein [Fimbriimonadaceae bacterium]|nr:alpha amylase family protein [Fimbriimonadaceae bacterium]